MPGRAGRRAEGTNVSITLAWGEHHTPCAKAAPPSAPGDGGASRLAAGPHLGRPGNGCPRHSGGDAEDASEGELQMSESTAYGPGEFCWVELASPDVDASA